MTLKVTESKKNAKFNYNCPTINLSHFTQMSHSANYACIMKSNSAFSKKVIMEYCHHLIQ